MRKDRSTTGDVSATSFMFSSCLLGLAASCVTLELVLTGQGQTDKALYSLAGLISSLPLQKEAQGNTKEGTLPVAGTSEFPSLACPANPCFPAA